MPWSATPSPSGIKTWTFTQSTPSNTWTIYHGMGQHPLVEVNAYDDNNVLQKAFPQDVVQVDVNTVLVTWSTPRRGIAILASSY